ncbi:MAG: hypothetical protein Q7U13_09300 [Rhodoferax sp.]|nr:hypothetical protein [Rhodoferax sp.]
MEIALKRLALGIASAGLLTIYGCGGGGGTAGGATTTPTVTPTLATTLSGTAAIGAPIAGSVFAIDINGKVSPAATTSELGAFIVDVAGMTAPFILSITGTAGGKQVTLNSIATAAGQTVNITPLTDLIVSTASGQPGGSSLASLCAPVATVVPAACLSALTSAATPATLASATQAVINMIAPLNPAGTNPLTDSFTANGTGMDAVLDQILVAPADAQGAMATITLIATNTSLGTVTLPGTPGQTATTTATAPSTTELAKATAAATVLPEIRACLASLNALYPKTGFVAPSSTQVAEFLDPSFLLGRLEDKTAFASALSGTGDMAIAGLTIEAVGLSPFDMSPLNSTEKTALSPTNSVVDIVKARAATAIGFDPTTSLPTSAWVQLHVQGDSGVNNWKMVKGAAYGGCPGGWRLAGSQHIDLHMNARIQRSLNASGVATFTRQWAFHINKSNVVDELAPSATPIDTVIVNGPGLSVYSGTPLSPVGGNQALILKLPVAPNLATVMIVEDSTGFYVNAEAIQSCQDLASTNAVAGAPCIDETKVAPGKLYSWRLKVGGTTGTTPRAFPFQISAVPLSKAFSAANQSSLFATVTSVTPSQLSAIPSSLLDGLVTINYTQTATYGSKMDNCGLYLWGTSTTSPVLNAEQNAVGRQTSCTFTTSGLNALASNVIDPADSTKSLFQFTGALTSGYIGVTTSVLGNQASSRQPYPN